MDDSYTAREVAPGDPLGDPIAGDPPEEVATAPDLPPNELTAAVPASP